MKISQLKEMNHMELIKKLNDLKKELIKARAQTLTLTNKMTIRNIKKDIARVLTLLNQVDFTPLSSSKSINSEIEDKISNTEKIISSKESESDNLKKESKNEDTDGVSEQPKNSKINADAKE